MPLESVPAAFCNKIHVIALRDFMNAEEIERLQRGVDQMEWNRGIPGGFVQNTPQRLVNSFGDGSGYDANANLVGDKWEVGYWTAAVHQSDSTLVTPLEPLPSWLRKFGVKARNVASDKYGIALNDHSFNLAVCNKYVDKNDEIAAHTDDNEWYVKDLAEGPMFASLTLYPNEKPLHPHEFARFELFIDGQWRPYHLPDASLLLMPSCIPHRVRRCVKTMFERVNITLRSVPSIRLDPFNSLRGTSNHARYYRLPRDLLVATDKAMEGHMSTLVSAFNDCLGRHKREPLVLRRTLCKAEQKKQRKVLVGRLKTSGKMTSKLRANVVNELIGALPL